MGLIEPPDSSILTVQLILRALRGTERGWLVQESSREWRESVRFLLAGAILAVLPVSLLAQAAGLIVGTVQDSSRAAIPGARVQAVNDLTGLW